MLSKKRRCRMNSLIKACKDLLVREPFYGLFLLNVQKEIVPKEHPIQTAGMGPNGINFTLYVNEHFWNNLDPKYHVGLLKHEMLHLIFGHCTNLYDVDDQETMNQGMDCEINQYIDLLPDGGVTLEKVSALLGEKLEPKKGSWYYYKKLQQYKQNNPLPNFIAFDDHSLWPKDLPEAEKKLLENQIKYKLKEVAEQVTKQAGSIPGELSELIKALKQKEPVFNWKKYFRRVIGNAITSEIQLTRMRPSKRFPDARGIRMKRKPNILVGVDTSGSVNNEEFAEFFAEIHHIYKTGVSVTVAECDTQITNIFEYKGNQDIKRTGYGGTVLNPIVDYYKEHPEFTVCVIFTDGYCDTAMPPCQNLIWVITSSGNKSTKYTPGKVIFIPNKA